ncbi:hypothetical protein BJV78DRAFT_1205795 [Lactifluus subvellereus]|nr:hypothetical protein BJV78DRAFT_1205795 [Lactifluus subvellereus]
MTGSCSRGLTCAYKHDPAKIPICWPYLQNDCPHTSEACALSHDSNPYRTPLRALCECRLHAHKLSIPPTCVSGVATAFALTLMCLATEARMSQVARRDIYDSQAACGWRGHTRRQRRAVR